MSKQKTFYDYIQAMHIPVALCSNDAESLLRPDRSCHSGSLFMLTQCSHASNKKYDCDLVPVPTPCLLGLCQLDPVTRTMRMAGPHGWH